MKSILEAKALFDAAGIPISDWAAANGFARENVYAVLDGRLKGKRGEAHRIAVALGLKRGIPTLSANEDLFTPPTPSQV